ncbi:lytic polysaccharide monooxygenase auxiliary activity family 9 protein [Rhizohabitans arisaemae]|uniref:lytic polysaccharide monooxygenase auxiliary activity family 9 protein n=1 Tax=Rhizohabitans arisaemae TaxID=2720610 RepID=UPI0024B12643|nr:lytic polysaccharide monooxygenase [Rhizohabitans arisaemae]
MSKRRTSALVTFVVLAPVAVSIWAVNTASAHGSMQTPASRTWMCFQDNIENPRTPACKAAVALGGTQPLYDWNEVNQANANGQHRSLIPDGKLCSGGRDKYRGFDQARADWPTTNLNAGSPYTFRYKATAPHPGTFEFYVTKDGYNPTTPLKWSDLEATPFHRVTNPPIQNEAYVTNATLPAGKSGRHLIYSIWQRSDSGEAFYTCSDVYFGVDPSPTITDDPTVSHSPTDTQTTGGVTTWAPNTSYRAGDRVTYAGVQYECRQPHPSLTGWEPPNVPALWRRL